MVWTITASEGIPRRFISYQSKQRYSELTARNQYILLENRANHMDCFVCLPAGQRAILSSGRNQG
jgi:hypothetical protein